MTCLLKLKVVISKRGWGWTANVGGNPWRGKDKNSWEQEAEGLGEPLSA